MWQRTIHARRFIVTQPRNLITTEPDATFLDATDMGSSSASSSSTALVAPKRRRRKHRKAAKKRSAQPARGAAAVENRWQNGIDWPVVVWIAVVHLGILAAPFYFTWKAVALMAVLHWLTGGIGVCLGYHRQLTHGSFSTYRPVRFLLALLGGLSGEGSAVSWVANHRKHHVFSDQEGDPHSPRDGGLWSHMLWFMPNFGKKYEEELTRRYAPDLVKERSLQWLHKMFLPSHVLMTALLLAVGWLGWDWYTGLSFVVWGMFVRLVGVLHVTWFVNSASHLWGYRNYETTDDSRNLWWAPRVSADGPSRPQMVGDRRHLLDDFSHGETGPRLGRGPRRTGPQEAVGVIAVRI
ncbi:MAG: hypothetical protein B7Z73_06005 [Planctomycetia bacterium 21-64-5]|nr:MAG: hypothetical protein B7Z73_06005 [Planctomycetia bacterium 21-64-5]